MHNTWIELDLQKLLEREIIEAGDAGIEIME
jgi:hypothetical protein